MLEINEMTRHTITIDFSDENDAPVIPASFSYRVEEPVAVTQIIATTTVTPVGSSYQLVIPAISNKCAGLKDELRRVTVVASGLAASEYIYKLRRLKGVS